MTKLLNKLLKIILCFLMILSVTTPTFGATSLNDHTSHWASRELQSALSSGIVSGYPDGSFKPNNAITRAEFFELTNNVFGFTSTTENTYTDVPRGAWYAPSIAKAEAAGYISGYPDGSFRPSAPTTRAEALVILTKSFNHDRVSTPNPDIVKIPVSTISISEITMDLIAGGSTGTLTPIISPMAATNKNVTWSSGNTDVATVMDGVVTPLAAGTTLISLSMVDYLHKLQSL